VWVAEWNSGVLVTSNAGQVAELDAATGTTRDTLRNIGLPFGLAVFGGYLWIEGEGIGKAGATGLIKVAIC
jgi:hypothetical protein